MNMIMSQWNNIRLMHKKLRDRSLWRSVCMQQFVTGGNPIPLLKYLGLDEQSIDADCKFWFINLDMVS